ncbi:unnamed protein product [Trifolium pratense]|uniref:Uncharacterized protein n=1 Tax=Trifolium pratense TaxID=57577 RepID=A0ACB0KSN5_TRIPR|nr:unnamed protein product [Trifolium pratense]
MMEAGFSRTNTMQIDPRRSRFPCSIVWSPLPVISWFIPFIGHIGICREDGVILDFAGPNFVCVDNFPFGAAILDIFKYWKKSFLQDLSLHHVSKYRMSQLKFFLF